MYRYLSRDYRWKFDGYLQRNSEEKLERVFVKILFDERKCSFEIFLNDFRQIKLEYGININW